MRIDTLADLQRHRCNLLIHCRSCQKWSERSVHQLTGKHWGPDLPPGDLTETIASVKTKLKCSRCGSREIETWPTRTGAAMHDWYLERDRRG